MPESLPSSPDAGPLPPFPVVGIGAAAGGLSALLGLLEKLPEHPGMAFIVILHLPAKDEESAFPILARATDLPVVQLKGTAELEPDRVYLVPYGHDLSLHPDSLTSSAQKSQTGATSIDHFFRSLADAYRCRAIGVVLSGAGSDGAVGLCSIREQGGVTLAQTPEDADHDSMPRAATASGAVDFILPAADMPARLLQLRQNALQIRLPEVPPEGMRGSPAAPEDDEAGRREAGPEDGDSTAAALPRAVTAAPDADGGPRGPARADAASGPASVATVGEAAGEAAGKAAEEALKEIMEILRVRTRHDFRHYKRATVLRRIERRLQVNGLPDLIAYRDYLRDHADETPLLLQDMLISVTNFFRDPAAMSALERTVLPSLVQGRKSDDPIRVWVVGCATGEEAYTIGILLHEQLASIAAPPIVQVFATDIDDRAISIARNGVYPGAIAHDVSPSRLRQFFVQEDDSYRVNKALRESVLFASHNILHDAPFSRIDLILCRNLLIYLDREAQTSIIDIFRYALKPGGHLFLGTSETADTSLGAFTAVDTKNRIYVANPRSPDRQGSNRLPAMAAGGGTGVGSGLPSARPRLPERPSHVPAQDTAGAIHQRILLEAAPPSVVVDADLTILHMTGGAGHFMVHASGAPSAALMANIHPDLRLELRTALLSAGEAGKPVEVRRIPILWRRGSQEEREGVNLRVVPYRDPRTHAAYSLVQFESVPVEQARGTAEEVDEGSIVDLRGENERLKEQLRQTIARFDSSNEELRASNAELGAINDALRRASEELETKKEELQSMNEELIAVNHELKAKVDETGQISDDLQNLSAAASIIAIFVDRGMNIKRFTPGAAGLFGLAAGGPVRTLDDIADELDHASLSDDAAESFRTLRPIERVVHGNDGRSYLARIQPYRTMRDSIEGAVLNLTDVTTLQQLREHLNDNNELLRLAAESSGNHAVVPLDQHGRIIAWNAAAERIFGYDSQAIIGQSFDVLSDSVERDRGVPDETLRGAQERGRIERERAYRRKDGRIFQGHCVMSALHGDPSRGFVESIRDLSDDREVQAVRNQLLTRENTLTVKLNAARRSQDELFDVLAGELQRPLNLIQVNADMLMRLPETRNIAVVGKVAESVTKAVASQAHIIEGLRDLSLARSGKLTLQMRSVSLRDLAKNIVTSRKDQAATKSLALDFHSDGDPLTAVCDPARIEQVIRILVSNAIKFTDHGGVAVRVARDGEFACLAVTDTGTGIAPEVLETVFESPESSPAVPAQRAGRGLGIGLALARELVTAHEGRIQAESEGAERGATFTVWLRLAEPLKTAASTAPEAEADNPLAGLRVVLVDDSVDLLTSFGALMTLEGAQVDSFDNADAALKRLLEADADLLISDLGMPGMDGYELIQEIRKHPKLAALPAIALTGYGRTRDPGHAVRSGFNAHTTKPATVEELKNIVALLKSL